MDFSVIADLRNLKGLTQEQLADELGVGRAALAKWERGAYAPPLGKIVELANYFHVTTDYLLGIEHKKTLDVSGLSDEDIGALINMATYMREKSKKEASHSQTNKKGDGS